MRFYNQQHKYYCGIDLHARKMYVCILDQKGKMKVHKNINTDPELFFELIFPYIDDIVVGVECVFCWYWMADFCNEHKIPFILGHALYMKVIHITDWGSQLLTFFNSFLKQYSLCCFLSIVET